MILNLSLLVCGAVLVHFFWEVRQVRPVQLALSSFWYFSFIFLIAFPLRAYLLEYDVISAQVYPYDFASMHYRTTYMAVALLVSFLLWVCAYWGRRQTVAFIDEDTDAYWVDDNSHLPSYKRVVAGVLAMAGFAAISFWALSNLQSTSFNGAEYQLARMGSGALWVIPELYVWTVLACVAWWVSHRNKILRKTDMVFLGTVVLLCVVVSAELQTRRLIAAAALACIILIVARRPKYWWLLVVSVLATVLAAPVLDFLRRLYWASLVGETDSLSRVIFTIFDEFLIYMVSSSFEGAGHLARFVERASPAQLWLGVDHGLSWLFNSGLAFVPRWVWGEKPMIYGGMAQFQWVYPERFKDGMADASIPMSFAVDFSFGLGLPFACFMAVVFGRLLGTLERVFWDRSTHVAQVALALYVYIFMFNWVRGGTIIIQSVALYSIPLALLFGLRPTLRAVFGAAGESIGLVGGDWRGTSRVYFYPHQYLRERQLDTIRFWAQDKVANPEVLAGRRGSNVTRGQALAPSRPSWKSRIPLVNIKRRPKDAPKDAAVYVWGGLINKGPFITDIDNPYAFTGYNVFAAKLFKIVIQSFLESPRCLQIRCMSHACLEGMREEYGEGVAAKCVLAYPYMAPALDRVKTQDAEKCRFVFVSTQFEIKGGAALLNAFVRVVRDFPGAQLDMVTHLPEHLAGQTAHIPNLHIYDAGLSREEVGARFLADADVLVHPTYMDSFGMVVLEGLAYGLPVIATDVYAIREMVEDGANGFLLAPPISSWSESKPTATFSNVEKTCDLSRSLNLRGFEDALYEAMLKMAQNAEFRSQAGARSLELVRTRFAKVS